MTTQREIPKQAAAPRNLPPEAVELINEILLGTSDELKDPCDALLIFGSSVSKNHRRIDFLVSSIYQTIGFSKVYIAGGVTVPGMPSESEQIYAMLASQYPAAEFLLDKTSTNTRDNVMNAISLGLKAHSNILFVAKAPHCCRCKLTLMKHLQDATIRHRGYIPVVSKDGDEMLTDWHLHPRLADFAWGEFLRIETYGKRGDIAYPDDLRQKVSRVHELVMI